MTELLHATGVRLGIVTNGEHWMLVDAPKGETTGYASWYASLWTEEKITLRALRSLLSVTRFFGVADDDTIEALLTKSASNQQEVTDQLGYQVRRAVEMLVQSLDKADQDHGRELLEGIGEAVLYESALTVMMRLVFLFCAEERELIPTKPFPVYEQNYSVSTISKQLREIADQQGEELLERRYDGWPRLLTACRAVHGGLQHDDVHIPAYGGSLFNPDRFPFLEGRKLGTSWRETESNPLPVNNRTVLHLLEALQLLQVKLPGGGPAEARRLSFRALDIEQIGHVYEGLLDHTAKRANEPFLGLTGTRNKEPELPVSELEKLLEKGEADLLNFLKAETGRTPKSLKKSLDAEIDGQDAARLRTACQTEELWKRVEPFAGLIRNDSFGYPWVVPKGSVFVTAGTDRRSSGTHYTPRSLTEPIVQYTLEPLVYVGPAEGKPKSEWRLKSAAELLDLKICDMACGSGAFLVQAARYMSERLLEAWETVKEANPDVPGITPEGEPSTAEPSESLVPVDPDERRTYAMRIIAQRCLYGVDINPLAVEMAKLSLWLLTLAKDKPFEFLDHAIRCGDSLVGLHDLEQLTHFSLKPNEIDEPAFSGPWLDGVDEAINLRLKLEAMPAGTVEDVDAQEKLLAEAEDKIARLRCAADLLVAGEFWGENAKDKQEKVRHFANVSGHYVEKGPTEEFEEKAAKERRGQKMFHWPLEFPEVIVKRGGFDAFVGNPPFLGGKRISTVLSERYNDYLKSAFTHSKGAADLCAYFFRQGHRELCVNGTLGLLATNTISQSATRKVGLDVIVTSGAHIYNAQPTVIWPGTANVHVSLIHIVCGHWSSQCNLAGVLCDSISPRFEMGSGGTTKPQRITTFAENTSSGVGLMGMGFVLDADLAMNWLSLHPEYASVLRPYMNGQEFNNTHDLTPSRYAINFGDISEEEASRFTLPYERVKELVKPERDKLTRQIHEHCFWKHWDRRDQLFDAIGAKKRTLACAMVTKHLSFAFLPTGWVYSQKLIVFPTDDASHFAILQSSLHDLWVRFQSPTLKSDLSYSVSAAFRTFATPESAMLQELETIGESYHEERTQVMLGRKAGLRKLYNWFHDIEEESKDIQKLRHLHVEMDQAVSVAYGWDDLDLAHGFYEVKQGLRYTISESARRELLQRFLKLNHERYEEEVSQGLHKRKGSKSRNTHTSAKVKDRQTELF